jgi:fructosamine-3-kinase
VESALASSGKPSRIQAVAGLAGGCVNHGARLEIEGGGSYFVKWNTSAPPEMFEAESDGLTALRNREALRVPLPVARGGGGDTPSWLLMEYVPRGRAGSHFDERLGRGLAELHRPGSEHDFGWPEDNWIGSLPQANTPMPSWIGFWRDRRIIPQLELARKHGYLRGRDGRILDELVDAIPRALADVDEAPAGLLHGDLWSGNVYPTRGGDPVIIDPAVYRGHHEVDLAMTELFGGFGDAFYAAYDDVRPIEPAYGAYRRELYQLYYLLVHVNLFGAGYEAGSVRAAGRVLGAV